MVEEGPNRPFSPKVRLAKHGSMIFRGGKVWINLLCRNNSLAQELPDGEPSAVCPTE